MVCLFPFCLFEYKEKLNFPGGPNTHSCSSCLSPGPIERPLPEGEVQPSQSVCDPGLPDCPVCQPQAPAPQVRHGAGKCALADRSGGTQSLSGGQLRGGKRAGVSVTILCGIWCLQSSCGVNLHSQTQICKQV